MARQDSGEVVPLVELAHRLSLGDTVADMGIFDGAQVSRMLRVFREHFVATAKYRQRDTMYPPELSDWAQLFWVAKKFAMKDARWVRPDVEARFLEEAVRVALPYVATDRDLFVEAINTRALAQNPKSDDHARDLRRRRADLDEAYRSRKTAP